MVTYVERPLQNLVNALFARAEPYRVIRSTVLLAVFLRLYRHVRRILRREGLATYLINALAPTLKKLPPVRSKLERENQDLMTNFRKEFSQELTQPRTSLPRQGMPEAKLLELMDTRAELDTKHWAVGKVTGAVYHGDQAHHEFIGRIFGKWAFANPLHPGIHPALRQMDSEVVRMVVGMYNGGMDACGAFTTGGTESILMAMKTYRDWAAAEKGITDPNIVVCNTAHAAFWKAGEYFNIFVKEARANSKMQADVRHVRRLIDANTVAIVGSCCQYAHGAVDPIEELAELARRRGIGLHVDCCLGGFLVPFMEKAGFPISPFDFRVPGVTSISCDPHKYGFAPKGASVLMFSNRKLRHHMYSCNPKWTGGIYGTATMTGSRAGAPVAATWASMCKHGEAGYIETTKRIVGATREIAKGIEAIPELEVVGEPLVCVVAFAGRKGSGVNCYAVADCMKKRFGWDLGTCQNPPSVHLALTLPTSKNASQFLLDLRESVGAVRTGDTKQFASTAGLYGMAASLPATFLRDAVSAYLDAASEAIEAD